MKRLLVLAGLIAPTAADRPAGARGRILGTWRAASWTVAFVFTWIVPIVGVVAMAWVCESRTRELGRRRRLYYNGEAGDARTAVTLAGRRRERRLAPALFPLLLAIPVAILAILAQQSSSLLGLSLPGVIVCLSLVIAAAAIGRRR